MKKTIPLVLTIMVLMSACTPSKKNEKSVQENDFENTTTYAFSDLSKLDTFKVKLVGKKSEEMQLIFTIKSFEGAEIYRQEIKVKELLKNYLASAKLKTETDKINFLKEEIVFFFDERHFLEPAVTENEHADNNVPDKDFYNELKRSGLNGFDYRLSKDKKIYIAWSAKEQKVKVYYECC